MTIRLTAEQAKLLGLGGVLKERRGSKPRKFRNKPTNHDSPVIGEKKFDSEWEATLCQILDSMVNTGQIKTFLDQVRVSLPGVTESGQRRFMVVDFMIIDLFGRCHWMDAKGFSTPEWLLKRDLAFRHHFIDVIPVGKKTGLPDLYTKEEMVVVRELMAIAR